MSEQHLRSMQAKAGERGLVGLHQPHLPHCRCRLELVYCSWTLFPSEPLHAFRNRSRRHQDDLLRGPTQCRDLLGPSSHCRMIDAASIVGYQAGAYFDDQAPSGEDR